MTRRILLQCFMAGRDRWPVLITVEISASLARYCYTWKTALRVLDIDPTTYPNAIEHRSDVKIFFTVLAGEVPHRVHSETKYLKYLPNQDCD